MGTCIGSSKTFDDVDEEDDEGEQGKEAEDC